MLEDLTKAQCCFAVGEAFWFAIVHQKKRLVTGNRSPSANSTDLTKSEKVLSSFTVAKIIGFLD